MNEDNNQFFCTRVALKSKFLPVLNIWKFSLAVLLAFGLFFLYGSFSLTRSEVVVRDGDRTQTIPTDSEGVPPSVTVQTPEGQAVVSVTKGNLKILVLKKSDGSVTWLPIPYRRALVTVQPGNPSRRFVICTFGEELCTGATEETSRGSPIDRVFRSLVLPER